MSTQGIRIFEKENKSAPPTLLDILEEVDNGARYRWSLLFLDASGELGEEVSIPELEKQERESEEGLPISWDGLKKFAINLSEIIDITIIGSKDEKIKIKRTNDMSKFDQYDIVIEKIDGWFWEILSKDISFIEQMSKKYEKTESI